LRTPATLLPREQRWSLSRPSCEKLNRRGIEVLELEAA
jgi:hypothetical protein